MITPRLGVEPRPVAGPPKRFAQAIGVVFSMTAVALTFGFDEWGAAKIVLGLLATAAFLESAFGFCLGCKAFALLVRAGAVPDDVCETLQQHLDHRPVSPRADAVPDRRRRTVGRTPTNRVRGAGVRPSPGESHRQ